MEELGEFATAKVLFPRRVFGEEFDLLAERFVEPAPSFVSKISDAPQHGQTAVDRRVRKSGPFRKDIFLSHLSNIVERASFNPLREGVGVAFRAFAGLLVDDFRLEPVLDRIGY